MDDGRVLVSGGFTGVVNGNIISPIPINTFPIYDPETDSWLLLAKDVFPSFGSGALRLSDGRYLSVGIDASEKGLEGTAGILDPENMLWATLPPPPEARGFPALTMLQEEGRVLLLSGLAPSDSDASAPVSIRDTATLDPATGTWKRAAPMNTAAGIPTVVSLDDGRVMVLQDGFSGAEIYDPASDLWTITSPANGTFSHVAAVKLPEGVVLVTGGASKDENADGAVPIAEIYDPYADAWTATEPMNEMRIHHTLTLLPSGQVIAIGGVGTTFAEPLVTSEIYDPITNTWRPGPEITEGRYEHTATLLSDGRILIFGGIKLNRNETEIEVTSSHEILELSPAGQ